MDAVEEFLRTKQAREPKTYAAYRGVLLGAKEAPSATRHPDGPVFPEPPGRPGQRRRRWMVRSASEGGAQDTKHRVSTNARRSCGSARARLHDGTWPAHRSVPRDVDGGVAPLDDVDQLLDAIPEFRLQIATAWLFYTGCRVGEAINAKQSDVRLIRERELYEWTMPDQNPHASERLATRRARPPPRAKPGREQPPGRLADPLGLRRAWLLPSRKPCRFHHRHDHQRGPRPSGIRVGLQVQVTAHPAKHTLLHQLDHRKRRRRNQHGTLSRQVGTSITVLRKTYVHVQFSDADWEHIRELGSRLHR